MARLKLATTWLGGCSGCHMSFLDLDEWLLELAARADLVYSPIIDSKEFPDGVDVTLIEGAVANEDHEHHVRLIRARSRVLVSFGDCAVTGNVTACRNSCENLEAVLRRSYLELATVHPGVPAEAGVLPQLVERVRPVHQVVPVEYYVPGCPPPAGHIRAVLEALLAGQEPQLEGRQIKFG
jgi:NAD-reducing hydrogenase small subunit